MPTQRLAHENLDVYQVSIDFLAIAMQVRAALPRGYADMGAQLERAALSIVLNIAEGYGKRAHKDRCRFYDISRALHRIVSMLVRLSATA